MPLHKHPHKKRKRRWIASVKTSAVDVPEGTMAKPAVALARTLLAANRDRDRDAGSINRFIQFYINRSGRNLPDERKRTLKRAMALVRRHG
jgi:predicted solute-binding protein